MTVHVDLSQAPARLVVTGSLEDAHRGGVPRFWLAFGGDGTADLVIEPNAPLQVATELRAAVMLLLRAADDLARSAHTRHQLTPAERVEPDSASPGSTTLRAV